MATITVTSGNAKSRLVVTGSASRSGGTVTVTLSWAVGDSAGNYYGYHSKATINGDQVYSATGTREAWTNFYGTGTKTLTYTGQYAAKTYSIPITISVQQQYGGTEVEESGTVSCSIDALSFTVTFNANGGSVTPTSKSYVYNSAYGNTLPTPTRTGYSFSGWYSAKSGGTEITSATTITGERTIYAHWAGNSYTTTFNANGGSVSPATKSYTYGSAYGTLPTPTRSGYGFDGWYTSASGGSKVTTSSTMLTAGAQTLYAHWTAAKYTVTFVYGNGSANTTATVTFDSTYGNVLPSPTRTGYTFSGWYTASSGGSKVTSSTTVSTASNHSLYGRWSAVSYTVTFNANGGSVSPASASKTYGSTYGDLPTPTRSGYSFLGWYTASSGGTKITSSSTVSTASNHTLYAHWESQSVLHLAQSGTVKTVTKIRVVQGGTVKNVVGVYSVVNGVVKKGI